MSQATIMVTGRNPSDGGRRQGFHQLRVTPVPPRPLHPLPFQHSAGRLTRFWRGRGEQTGYGHVIILVPPLCKGGFQVMSQGQA